MRAWVELISKGISAGSAEHGEVYVTSEGTLCLQPYRLICRDRKVYSCNPQGRIMIGMGD